MKMKYGSIAKRSIVLRTDFMKSNLLGDENKRTKYSKVNHMIHASSTENQGSAYFDPESSSPPVFVVFDASF